MEEAKQQATSGVWNPEETTLKSDKKDVRFEAFEKIELKVAEIIDVQRVQGADKLLQFRLDAGDSDDRQILSGIAEYYPEPKELLGKKVIIVANLKPRKMRGQISQGMLLSSEDDQGHVQLVTVPEGIKNGSTVE